MLTVPGILQPEYDLPEDGKVKIDDVEMTPTQFHRLVQIVACFGGEKFSGQTELFKRMGRVYRALGDVYTSGRFIPNKGLSPNHCTNMALHQRGVLIVTEVDEPGRFATVKTGQRFVDAVEAFDGFAEWKDCVLRYGVAVKNHQAAVLLCGASNGITLAQGVDPRVMWSRPQYNLLYHEAESCLHRAWKTYPEGFGGVDRPFLLEG